MALHLPASPLARGALLVAAVAIVVLAVVGGRGLVDRRARIAELENLRERLADLRAAAEQCQLTVRRQEQAFADYRARVDSLRQEVRDFEAMDERGVPAARYEEYLDAFDDYNEAVPIWEERADTLRARSQACRDLTERHNTVADSLRAVVSEVETDG